MHKGKGAGQEVDRRDGKYDDKRFHLMGAGARKAQPHRARATENELDGLPASAVTPRRASLLESLFNGSLDDGFRVTPELPKLSLVYFDVPPRARRIVAGRVWIPLVLELQVEAEPVHLLKQLVIVRVADDWSATPDACFLVAARRHGTQADSGAAQQCDSGTARGRRTTWKRDATAPLPEAAKVCA